ncbi:hypothetical protein Rhow_003571 [Rhodococcus wratislaviensis]|uniref:Uncharacterized protein n=1 Tax=Rhodococcus wratislaviensis TaxID=44752 RepID=A0A402C8N4_RHOWR|nr:hypothetical protein Rhow_003571 [Rhodococcus wratislaviensis]
MQVATSSVTTACTAHPTDFNDSTASIHSIPNPASPHGPTHRNRVVNARSSSRSGAIISPTTCLPRGCSKLCSTLAVEHAPHNQRASTSRCQWCPSSMTSGMPVSNQ